MMLDEITERILGDLLHRIVDLGEWIDLDGVTRRLLASRYLAQFGTRENMPMCLRSEAERVQGLKSPSREYYTVTSGGARVQVWASFLHTPIQGETKEEFLNRLEQLYRKAYSQSDFEIEPSYHPDGRPKSAMVYLRDAQTAT